MHNSPITGVAEIDASHTLARVDTMLSRYSAYGMSGVAHVRLGKRIDFAKPFGLADRQRHLTNEVTTVFDVGSVTKTFTAAAILRLSDAGKLRVSDSMSRFIPEFRDKPSNVTIHQLLTHTAGFPLDAGEAGITPADNKDSFIVKAANAKLLATPGSAYNYSNLGYGLLGIIVERASGRPYSDYVTRELIDRAGLRATRLYGDPLAINHPRAAIGYIPGGEDTLVAESPIRRENSEGLLYGKYTLGSVGVISTANDLARWWDALSTSILRPETRQLMLKAAFGDEGYGWHIATLPDVGQRIYRGGARGGFTSLVAIYPSHNASLVLLLNQQAIGWESLVWKSFERALSNIPDSLPPAVVSLGPDKLAEFAGEYAINDSSRIVVRVEGDHLLIGAHGQDAIDMALGIRSTEKLRMQNSLSLRLVVDALKDSSRFGYASIENVPGFISWVRQLAAKDSIEILGSALHPSGRGRTQTFVRFGGQNGTTGRVIWDSTKVLAWGTGVRLPALLRLRPNGSDTFAAFGPRQTLTLIRFHREGDGAASSIEYVRAGEAQRIARRRRQPSITP